MSFWEIWQTLTLGFLPAITPFLVVCVCFSLCSSLFSRVSVRITLPLVLAFGLLGGVTGFAVGVSRVPVVGVVLPAMLTFTTGLLGYVFSKEKSNLKYVIPFCLIVVYTNSLLGLFIGSQLRGKHEEYERQYTEWLLHYEKVTLEVEKSKEINK